MKNGESSAVLVIELKVKLGPFCINIAFNFFCANIGVYIDRYKFSVFVFCPFSVARHLSRTNHLKRLNKDLSASLTENLMSSDGVLPLDYSWVVAVLLRCPSTTSIYNWLTSWPEFCWVAFAQTKNLDSSHFYCWCEILCTVSSRIVYIIMVSIL